MLGYYEMKAKGKFVKQRFINARGVSASLSENVLTQLRVNQHGRFDKRRNGCLRESRPRASIAGELEQPPQVRIELIGGGLHIVGISAPVNRRLHRFALDL